MARDFRTAAPHIFICRKGIYESMVMDTISKEERTGSVPKGMRKELLRSNIKSVMEKTTLEIQDNRSFLDQDLEDVTSVKSVDPEFGTLEQQRMDEIRKAKEELLIIEKEMKEEFERLLSQIKNEE
jgi:hypothetical protein